MTLMIIMSVKNGNEGNKTLSLQEHHDIGMEFYSTYNYASALVHLFKSVKDEKYCEDWNQIAICLFNMGMFDKLIKTFPEETLENGR